MAYLSKILTNLSIEEKLILKLLIIIFKTSQNKDLTKINPYKNILKWLNTRNILTGVTSKDQLRTIELVEKYNINVDIIVTPELTKR